MKKSVYIGFKFLHMGAHSGYDIVKFYAGYDIFIDCQNGYNWLQKFMSTRSLLARIYGRIFGSRLWWIEWYCLFLSLFNRNLVFHFIYAENIYRYLGWFKWLGFKIVCTYHQPDQFFLKNPEFLKGMRYIDDVIVLSEDVVQEFKKFKGDKNVHFIPHGVDIEFFSADSLIPRKREILMVGNWLRNFGFADQIFARLLQVDSEMHIHVVASQENLDSFGANARLHLHFGITDEELLLLYRSAALLFLPLHGFVANNAILEGAAVGCPILLASDQEESLMPATIVEYIPLLEDVALPRILGKLDKPDQQEALRTEWVAQNFSWSVIGDKTRKILKG